MLQLMLATADVSFDSFYQLSIDSTHENQPNLPSERHLPNKNYHIKPDTRNQTYPTNHNKTNLPNRTHQTKLTKEIKKAKEINPVGCVFVIF